MTNAMTNERFIGRILEQTANEIGHAGNELPERRIDPNALVERHERRLQRIGHAEQRLELDEPFRKAPRTCGGECVRDARVRGIDGKIVQVRAIAPAEPRVPRFDRHRIDER